MSIKMVDPQVRYGEHYPRWIMTYANLMVAMTLGRSNADELLVARDLAQRLRAGVVGVAAYRPIEVVCADLPAPAKVFEADRKQCTQQSAEAEQAFRSVLGPCVERLEWRLRSALRPLADQIAHEARSADLVVMGIPPDRVDPTRWPDIRDLVMSIGRPVLIVPPAGRTSVKRMLVGWKDTPATHRAIADAIPLLRTAEDVVLAGIAATGELEQTTRQMEEVETWLKQHGVTARHLALPARGANANQLDRLADELDAGLLVIGAYGHLRQSQWVLGGITAAALRQTTRLTLLSH
jgi:nucleotide-binding universal stress UspA family protein